MSNKQMFLAIAGIISAVAMMAFHDEPAAEKVVDVPRAKTPWERCVFDQKVMISVSIKAMDSNFTPDDVYAKNKAYIDASAARMCQDMVNKKQLYFAEKESEWPAREAYTGWPKRSDR